MITVTAHKMKAREIWSYLKIMWEMRRAITKRYGSMTNAGLKHISKSHIRNVSKTSAVILSDNAKRKAFD